MQSPTDPADRTGTIGVEAFDATYGAGFQASDDSPQAVECELVEDAGAFVAHRPIDADRPRRVAFVDGTLRTEARLTRTGADGRREAWAWREAGRQAVTTGRAAIFTGGRPVRLPDHRDGWRWEPSAAWLSSATVKTHHRRMLARDHWVRVPELTAGERSGLFAMEDALYRLLSARGRPQGRGRVPGQASPALRCRQASAATPRGRGG